MKEQFFEAVFEIEREKGIDRQLIIATIEDAIHSAYKKNFGVSQKIEVHLDHDTKEAEIVTIKEVVEQVKNLHSQISLEEARRIDKDVEIGGSVRVSLTPEEFGRISAQVAKQVILQRIRETEREIIYEEFKSRVGEVTIGVVRREQGDSVLVDLGKIEGILPSSEQSSIERYRVGDRIRVYILDVKKTNRGPQIILSRTYRDLVKKLFEMEVPEILEGVVTIEAVARDPGFRSKIAVRSNDEKIDGVGACVGVRGIRVQAVVNELGGEKIDVVPYNPDPAIFIENALSPARIKEIRFDKTAKSAIVTVPDNQLSLAIGKNGQNVRLAAKLTNWRIDIKSESQFLEEERIRRSIPLTALPGVGPKTAENLTKYGISTISEIVNLKPEDLLSISGIGKEKAIKIWKEAQTLNQTLPGLKDLREKDKDRKLNL